MLKANTHGNALGFHLYACRSEIAIHVARTVPRGENDRSAKSFFSPRNEVDGLHAHYAVGSHTVSLPHDEPGHTRLEMHLPATLQDGVTHILYDPRKLVRSDMRMGIGQDIGVGPMLTEDIENLVHTAPFLAARI